MDRHAKDYYQAASGKEGPHGNFHLVIPLNDSPHLTWEKILEMVPSFPRGWYELAHLSSSDRIEFTRDFWLAKLAYHPEMQDFVVGFFRQLDEVGIFLTQSVFDAPIKVEMVYSIAADGGFFHGEMPASEMELEQLRQSFVPHVFPRDYLSFFRIHNGFRKYMDTGIFGTELMSKEYRALQEFLGQQEPLITSQGIAVDPATLIPFYESFGLRCYQCFWAEWYPQDAMGNVYYSGITKTLSDNTADNSWAENMAFPTFNDWLMFYLERID